MTARFEAETRTSAETGSARLIAMAVEALRAVLADSTGQPVGGGDGQTFVVRPLSGQALRTVSETLAALRAQAPADGE